MLLPRPTETCCFSPMAIQSDKYCTYVLVRVPVKEHLTYNYVILFIIFALTGRVRTTYHRSAFPLQPFCLACRRLLTCTIILIAMNTVFYKCLQKSWSCLRYGVDRRMWKKVELLTTSSVTGIQKCQCRFQIQRDGLSSRWHDSVDKWTTCNH